MMLYGEILSWSPMPVNPVTPVSDHDRISPYNIYTKSSRQVMGI